MLLLRWLWIGNGQDGDIPPIAVFWTLRFLMFLISFVLEDWALHEQITSTRHRRVAVLLVASSYVTWTFQTHTFSNSIETLAVLWSLVLIERITDPHVSFIANYPCICIYTLHPMLMHFGIVVHLVLCGSGHGRCLWFLQPGYFSSVSANTRTSINTSFSE